jgi:hypothetical protein
LQVFFSQALQASVGVMVGFAATGQAQAGGRPTDRAHSERPSMVLSRARPRHRHININRIEE